MRKSRGNWTIKGMEKKKKKFRNGNERVPEMTEKKRARKEE